MTSPDDLEEPAKAMLEYMLARHAAPQAARACLLASPLLAEAMDMLSVGIALPGATEKRIALLARYARLTDTDGDRNAE